VSDAPEAYRDGSAELPPSAEQPQASPTQRKAYRELLDQVIDRSMNQFHQWLDGDQLLPALREVAQRHPDQPLSIDPVATELVVCALAQFWAHDKPGAREFWRVIAMPVAESLLANEVARTRLESLWAELKTTG
jgi:hypothetical protein